MITIQQYTCTCEISTIFYIYNKIYTYIRLCANQFIDILYIVFQIPEFLINTFHSDKFADIVHTTDRFLCIKIFFLIQFICT